MVKQIARVVEEDEFSKIVSRAAREGRCLAERLAGMGRFEPLVLAYQEGTEASSGALKLFRISEVLSEGWIKAETPAMKGDVPYDSFGTWIRERSTRLPVLKHQKAA